MEKYNLHVFETAMLSRHYSIDKVKLNDQREVKKVEGQVTLITKKRVDGIFQIKKKVLFMRWDAQGIAFSNRNNNRTPQFDLPLKKTFKSMNYGSSEPKQLPADK
jgi:hypothetical protein